MWQPIETAPKTKREGVLGYIPQWQLWASVFWNETEKCWCLPMRLQGFMAVPTPQCWMPLPAPPTE